MPLTTYQLEEWFDLLQAKDVWFGIFFDDPTAVVDPLTVEYGGPSYSRPQVTWSRPGPVLLRNANALSWTGLTAGGVVAAIGGFDAATNGNLLFVELETADPPLAASSTGVVALPASSFYLQAT